MKTSRFNRILSALLAFVLFLGCIPAFPVLAQEEQGFRITLEGEMVTELKLYPHEKIRVWALGLENGENYQWQILHPERENVWINIYDAKTDGLNISVALVKNMLSPDNTAQLRCRANAGGEQVFTPALKVILLDGLTPVVIIPEETTPPTAVTEPEVTETTQTTVPAEETESVTEPTESVEVTEPEVTETTVPVEDTEPEATETTAPSEETTAPAEPDVSVPETTEPEQTIPVETTVPTESVVLETEAAAVTEETAAATEPVETVAETVPETTAPAETEATEATVAATEETIPVTEPETMTIADAAPVRFTVRSTAAAAQAEGEETEEPEETEAPEFVQVTIEYLRYDYKRNNVGQLEVDGNGNPIYEISLAFNPYVATLKYGANLETVVENPTLVGYQAWTLSADGTTEVESDEIDIDLTNITENKTITVNYRPALVDYAVRYYFQNIYDDEYVEDTTKMRVEKGYTGNTPPDSVVKQTFDGYTPLYYQPDAIAADGSTVFATYYERNYYLMEFDCTGGYGTDTLYVRYGTYISVPNPVRTGYVFKGWDLDKRGEEKNLANGEKDDIQETMPTYNSGYKAIWDTTDTTYTVVYWRENANDNGYSYWGSAQKDARSATKVSGADDVPASITTITVGGKTRNEKNYFTFNEKRTDKDILVEGDGSTVVNVYYTRNVYKLQFQTTGRCAMSEHTHTDACKEAVCGYKHVHDESCTREFTCTLQEHTAHTAECLKCGIQEEHTAHTESCLICGKTNHKHSDDCCTIPPHEHSTACCSDRWHNYWGHECNTNQCTYGYEHTHGQGCEYCSLEEHDHSADCYKDTIHTHDAACYKDTIHIHNDACYTYSCGEDTHIHEESCYKISCGKVAHTHNTNCTSSRNQIIYTIEAKYDQKIYFHFPIVNENNSADYTGYRWKVPNGSTFFTAGNNVLAIDTMPGESLSFTSPSNGTGATVWYYLETLSGEGDVSYEGKNFAYYKKVILPSGGNLTKAEEFHDITGFTQWKSNPSFGSSNSVGKKTNNYMYYSRNRYVVEFYNYNADLTDKETTKLYEESVSDLYFTPDYPSGIEPGAYEFKGWYTTDKCFPGTEFDFSGKMPANDVKLYAKWAPVTHNVYFYLLYSDIGSNADDDPATPIDTTKCWQPDSGNPVTYPIRVKHGELLGTTYDYIPSRPEKDSNGDNIYTFIGWFYMDDENKKKFAPDSMEITQDLHLFAEWQSGTDTSYLVRYLLDKETVINGTKYPAGTVLADPTSGHITAGATKTFQAKGSIQMKEEFQQNLFPTINSHSILMDSDSSHNTFDFRYVYDSVVYYKVRYVNNVTGAILGETNAIGTSNAIVTEKFKPINGYVPTQYYVTKTLKTDGDNTIGDAVLEDNILTFYYNPDVDHGTYVVEHYQENPDSTDHTNPDNYTRTEYTFGIADMYQEDRTTRNTIAGEIRVPNGFEHVVDLNTRITYKEDGTVDKKVVQRDVKPGQESITNADDQPWGYVDYRGLTLKLYYRRKTYPYVIEYREHGTEKLLKTITTSADTAKFDTVETWCLVDKENGRDDRSVIVTETVTNEDNTTSTMEFIYNYYISNPTTDQMTKSMTIRAYKDDPNTTEVEKNPNTLVFYFNQKQVQVNYLTKCTMTEIENYGTVSINGERAATAAGLGGSGATPAAGFKFLGWYTNPECTNKVPDNWVEDRDNDAEGIKEYIKPRTLDTTLDNVYYYALFEPMLKDLIIRKTATGGSSTDSFLFRVQGRSGTVTAAVDMIVVLHGSADSVTIKDLYAGYYTVTELTNWSWAYDCTVSPPSMQNITENNVFTFENQYKNPDWLGGENYRENIFS